MVTQARNVLVVAFAAAVALAVFGWPNPNFQDEERGRLVTLTALSTNDTLVISAKVYLGSTGKVLDENYERVGDNFWTVDVYVPDGDRVRANLQAWVSREDNTSPTTVTVRITDNGRRVREDGPVPAVRDTAHAHVNYVS